MGLLFATVILAFGAVVRDLEVLALYAAIGAAFAVLLGIAVDVFDAARQARTAPAEAMMGSHIRAG
jgi:hypothetical protein